MQLYSYSPKNRMITSLQADLGDRYRILSQVLAAKGEVEAA